MRATTWHSSDSYTTPWNDTARLTRARMEHVTVKRAAQAVLGCPRFIGRDRWPRSHGLDPDVLRARNVANTLAGSASACYPQLPRGREQSVDPSQSNRCLPESDDPRRQRRQKWISVRPYEAPSKTTLMYSAIYQHTHALNHRRRSTD